MKQGHSLGWGHGTVTEHDDGTIEYRQTARVEKAFRVNVADITTVHDRAATKADKKNLQPPGQGKALNHYVVVINGRGTTLAEVRVQRKTARLLKAWLEERIAGADPTTDSQSIAPADSGNVAAELSELAELHTSGMLTAEEYSAAKRRVLEQ
jgi:hypothetical protein